VANNKSAIKDCKQNVVRRASNRDKRSRVKHAIRAVRAAIDGGDSPAAKEALRTTLPLIDRLASKGVIHANAAARYKSRLTKRLQKISATA